MAGDGDGPAVGFCDGPADGQAHAGAGGGGGAVTGAVELFEDERLLERVDAYTAIGDAAGDGVGAAFGADEDGLAGGGVLGGVLEEIGEELLDPGRVGTDQGQVGGEEDGDLVIGEAGRVSG